MNLTPSLLSNTSWFNSFWYQSTYLEVMSSGLSPEMHYIQLGEGRGYRASALFDGAWYLEKYPDVAQSGISPLAHFIFHGEQEGRLPCRLFALEWDDALWTKKKSVSTCILALEALLSCPNTLELSFAAFALGRWFSWKGEWAKAAEYLSLRKGCHPSMPAHSGPLLLLVEALTRSGQIEAAWRQLAALHHERVEFTDAYLAVANLLGCQSEIYAEAPTELKMQWQSQRLHWLNYVWKQSGLMSVVQKDPSLSMALDNLAVGDLANPVYMRAPKTVPLVSVIVPAYNACTGLLTALESLAVQTLANFYPGALEVIVVDDASSDNTAYVAREFADKNSGFEVLTQAHNAGAYAARNRGLSVAKGDYITIHDSDDWSHPQKLEMQWRGLEDNPEWVACNSHWVRCSTDMVFTCWRMEEGWTYRNTSSLMFRRKVFETIGYWDRVRAEADTEYYYRILAAFGKHSIGDILPGVPMAFGRMVKTSLTSGTGTHLVTQFSGVRADYRKSSQAWHQKARSPKDLYLPEYPEQRPFMAPDNMLV